jgi:16S rRNA C967 or C1407 C5-methylase (RsmB/RsmF family)
MGGNKRHIKGGNSAQDKKRRKDFANEWKQTRGDDNRVSWENETKNIRFEAFYKAQHFINDGEDWDSFMKALRTPLPACFRISPNYLFKDELEKELLSFVGQDIVLKDGQIIESVQYLKWCPNGYKLGVDRRMLRKSGSTELEALHKWMMQHTDNGNITRQEAVSMVPPLALNVSPNHKCLDMCAAPGSKTSQLLEIVSQTLNKPDNEQGIVVANDADTDRAYMLVHQCRRINSPLLIVTTHKGQSFPRIHNAATNDVKVHKDGYFDRVLADVPCSGDGTLRKNPMIWGKWATMSSSTLHPLQLIIAQRGFQLLKTNGLLVYSTCSLSPYENEAVVAELLRSSNGQLELVDAREFVPKFTARPGLSEWHVFDDHYAIKRESKLRQQARKREEAIKLEESLKLEEASKSEENEKVIDESSIIAATPDTIDTNDTEAIKPPSQPHDGTQQHDDPYVQHCIAMGMQHFSSYDEVPEYLRGKRIRRSMFSPTEEEKSWMNLDKCLRCAPHDEDTGGFFVATLRKVEKKSTKDNTKNISISQEECDKAINDAKSIVENNDTSLDDFKLEDNDSLNDPNMEAVANKGPNNKGLVDFSIWDIEQFTKIKEFYGFEDSLTYDCFYVREEKHLNGTQNNPNKGPAKSVYFLPKVVRNIILEGDKTQQLKIVSAGIKVLERKIEKNNLVDYRLLQDGAASIVPHITKRKLMVTIQDFCNILGGGLCSFSTLHPDTVRAVNCISTGALICMYKFSYDDMITAEGVESTNNINGSKANTEDLIFHCVCWRGHTRTINVMCGKTEIEFMKHQLASLQVLRPKISAERNIVIPPQLEPIDIIKSDDKVEEVVKVEDVDVKMSI